MNKKTIATMCLILGGLAVLVSAPAAAQGVMFVKDNRVGIHTSSPLQEFHLNDGPDANANAGFRISTAGFGWDFATINTGGQFKITRVGSGASEFSLLANGNLIISGTLKTSGTTCGGGGCDLVFSPDATLPSLQEHAEAMWNQGYLPAVGPTPEMEPMNITEKVGGILHELEMSHIYIEQLHKRLEASQEDVGALKAENEVILARLRQIEESLERAQ